MCIYIVELAITVHHVSPLTQSQDVDITIIFYAALHL